jgi:hypothetical protein
MVLITVRERIKSQAKQAVKRVFSQSAAEVPPTFRPAWSVAKVKTKAKQKPFPAHDHRVQAESRLTAKQANPRFAQEREKMESAPDLRQVADDVEAEATLFEWHAQEHGYRPKSARWYIGLATGVTAAVGLLVFLGNVLGAIAVAVVGILIYTLAQRTPDRVRYRLMVDGIAINDRLHHYQDLDSFNIVYEPGQVKTVIVRSKKILSPLVQMEIGEADPVEIRDILLEFLREDLQLQEPVTDTWARRLGF